MKLFYANKINFLIVCQVGIYSNSSWCLKKEKIPWVTSLMVQWLRLWASKVGGTGSILSQETEILHAMQHSQINYELN